MSFVPRVEKLGSARQPFRPHKVRSSQPPVEAGTAAAALELSGELLSRATVPPEIARRAFDRFRERAGAAAAVFWTITGPRAKVALRAGPGSTDEVPSVIALSEAVLVERLRRRRTIICRAGELSGVEALVPDGVRSFAAFAAPDDEDVTGVLVVGWHTSEPPCDDDAIAHLRLAAAALTRTVAKRPDDRARLADSILGSIAHRLVVVDRDGMILWANAAWNTAASQGHAVEPVQADESYFEWCGRAIVDGSADLGALREGVARVARREAPLYEATLRLSAAGREEWLLLNATPLRHASDGAVVAHIGMTPEKAGDRASRLSERGFYDLIDALPMPVWIHGRDGRVIHGNARWRHVANLRADGDSGRWTDLFHPTDRARVIAAFQADGGGQRDGVDARIRTADGTYRWSICGGAPFAGVDGHRDAFIGYSCDGGVLRHGESAQTDMPSRLAVAQEEERIRIARELHDDLGQQAAVLASQISALTRSRQLRTPRLRCVLADANRNVQELAASIHDLSHQLHPPKLKLLGLVRTLGALCRDVSKQTRIRVRFRASEVPADVPERIALCIYRVTQEAVQNAVKHSGAREIGVELTGEAGALTLDIVDRGRGFDPSALGTGLGLLSMRERVELNGGRFEIASTPGDGTRIEAMLPLPVS
jgi:signal transduction histidine kinase